MKKIDPKSLIIGALATMLVFSSLGLRSKTDELGHLVVRSLTIEDDRGVIMGYLGNGYMQTYNQYGEPTLFVGTGKDGGGYMRSYNGNGDESADSSPFPLYDLMYPCLLYTSPSPRDQRGSRMPSSA